MGTAAALAETQLDPLSVVGKLRAAHRKAATLAEADRRRALVYCLAYELRDLDRRRVPEVLHRLLAVLVGGGAADLQEQAGREGNAAGGQLPGEVWRALDRFLRRYLGEGQPLPDTAEGKLTEVERSLERIGHQVAALIGPDADPNGALSALLERAGNRSAAAEEAVVATAQEFFDRLLQALAPAAAREFVGKPGFRPAPIYKAAVFDAYEEKFSQLAEYHGKGRLVRDFKASFKRNMRR